MVRWFAWELKCCWEVGIGGEEFEEEEDEEEKSPMRSRHF